MAYTDKDYLDIYEQLTYARECSLVIEEYSLSGKMPGFQHPGIGDEAVMVGIWSELQPNDWIVPEHRNRPMLGKAVGLECWLAEIMGKKSGFNGGFSGDSHFYNPEHHIGPYSGFLGQAQALAVGRALQYKLDKVDGCVVIGCGDGTANEGIVGEALNMIAAWKLPVVWYIQNNGWSIASKFTDVTGLTDMSQRAQGYGIASGSYDGTNILTVKEVMHEAMAKARKGEPTLVEFHTKRWTGHFLGDPQELYRDMAEVDYAKSVNDPVKKFREFLIAHGTASQEELDAITAEQHKYCVDCMENALKAEYPDLADVLDPKYVYTSI